MRSASSFARHFAPKHLLLAGLIAATGAIATAQTPAPGAPTAASQPMAGAPGKPGATKEHRGPRDPAEFQKRMAEHHAKRQADLKAALKLTPAQEGAWTNFTQATQPPAGGPRQGPRMDREEFKKLNTPQRIDLMEKRSAERQVHMKQRGDAVKAFYAQLNPDQQKVFDERGLRHGKREGQRGERGERGHRGGHHGGPGPRG